MTLRSAMRNCSWLVATLTSLPVAAQASTPSFRALAEAPPARTLADTGSGSCAKAVSIPNVYLHSGEFHWDEVDLVIPGRGMDFVWQRRYRSRLGRPGELGHSWDFSYNLKIEPEGTANLRLWDGNGRSDVYERRVDGSYVAKQFCREGRFNLDGSFTLVFGDLGQWNFLPLDGSPAQGKVQTIVDRNGNCMEFVYDSNGLLGIVIDTLGREIMLARNASGLITSLTDWTGRQCVYDYYLTGQNGGSPGDLKSARSPTVVGTPKGNDFPAGKTTTYTYSKGFVSEELNHNLRTITDPLGRVFLRNTYGGPASQWRDLLVRQRRGDPGDLIHVTYHHRGSTRRNPHTPLHSPVLAIVNDRVGNVSEYQFDGQGRCQNFRQFTGRANPDQPTSLGVNRPGAPLRAGDPAFFETRWAYDEDSRPTKTWHGNGNVTRWVYELELNPAAEWRSRGNLRELHRLPGSYLPVGDQTSLSEYFEYSDGFGCCGGNFVTLHQDPRGNVTTHSYDGAGNRLQTVHRIATIVEDFTYNSFGQMLTHVWPENGSGYRQTDQWVYYGGSAGHQQGYLESQIVDAATEALTTNRTYDPVGNVIAIRDPRGNTTNFVFNELNQVVRQTSEPVQLLNDSLVQYTLDTCYDDNDNVVTVDNMNYDCDGVLGTNTHLTTAFEYDLLNHPYREIREVSPTKDTVMEYHYDANHNQALKLNGEATNGNQPENAEALVYDERDLLFLSTRGFGGASQSTRQFDYDGNGNVVRVKRGLEGAVLITESTLDAYNREQSKLDPMGNVTYFTYDPNGNVVRSWIEGEICDVLGNSSNVKLAEATHVYDAMDRRIQTHVLYFDPATQLPIGNGTSQTLTQYTGRSEIASTTDDNGNVTQYSYDTVNRQSQRVDAKGNAVMISYDGNNNVVQIVEQEISDTGGPTVMFQTTKVFDEVNRQVAELDTLNHENRFGYSSQDDLCCMIDALGNESHLTFDGINRLIGSTRVLTVDGVGGETPIGQIVRSWGWDDSSRLTQMADDNGNVTRYDYDGLNRRMAIDFEDGTSESYSHDVHGNVVFKVDANGTQVTSTYDGQNRISGRTVVAGSGVSTDTTFEIYKHDGLSRLVYAEDDDSVVTRHFDSLSNLMEEVQNGKAFLYSHDGLGNELTCQYPGGKVVQRTFDELNRVQDISNDGPSASYEYVGPHRVQRRKTGAAALTTDFKYDEVRRITGIDHMAGPTEIDRRSFEWDAQYNKTKAADVRSGGPGLTHDFSYDSQYRLTETLVTNGSSSTERQTMYAFDGVGNRLTVMDDSCPGSYTMDSASPEPADQQMNQYTTTPCVGSIAWDQNGNEINRNGSDLMSRDYRDQLVQHSRIGGATTAYAYDALGRAISKHQGGTTGTWYYFAGTDPVEERDALDQVTVEYVRGPASDIVEMIQLGNPLFFFCDDLGSTRAVTDGAGNVLERYEYEDYGKPVFLDPSGTPAASSVIGNQYLFTGYRYDDESSFYYAKARHFDPQAGRFLGRDPLGIWGDSLNVGNGYTYVGNNPQTLVDPTGMYSDNVTCGGEFARNVFWDREDCSSSRKAGIEAGLCKAMNGAGAGDRAARIWTTYEMNGYPGGWSFLVGAAFGKWFAGPDFVVGKLWSLLIGATMSDIWKPFKNFTVFPIECESVSDPFNACGPNTVAYVHSSDSDIHLCTMWHSMAVDRRASVFLHELAHAEADAEDHFYYTTWGDPTKITTLSFPNIAETPILATNADTYGQMYLEFFLK